MSNHHYKENDCPNCCSCNCDPIEESQYDRRRKAICERGRLFNKFKRDRLPDLESNNDDDLPDYWGSYSKALPRADFGLPDSEAYESLLNALETGDPYDFDKIPLGGQVKLANPQAVFAFDVIGGDSWIYSIKPAPSVTSSEAGAEMVEVYAKAELRDIPFDEYDTNGEVAQVVDDMNKLVNFTGPKENGQVTAKTLFRGQTDGDLIGNYLSQFLILSIPFGATTIEQKYKSRDVGTQFLTTRKEIIDILNGRSVSQTPPPFTDPSYIVTGRDLTEYVHMDPPYQTYVNSALILLGMGAAANPGSPYRNHIVNQGAFVTFGIADITTFLGELTRAALKAAWVEKWARNRKIRPEAFALRIDTNRTGDTDFDIHPQILSNDIVQRLINKNGNALMPCTYPEGCPTHPSYPAGHAVISGACTTALKAFFDENYVIQNPKKVKVDGSELEDYTGDALTVGNELNKLANNMGIGRNMAGIHYRSDGDQGILLGEQVAIRALKDLRTTYNEPLKEWSFTGFDGQKVCI